MANSKKYGERCIAGVVVNYAKGKIELKNRDNGRPQWIRPVTNDEHGQVPSKLVQDVVVGDLLEISALSAEPDGFQSENVLFSPRSIRRVKTVKFTENTLEHLADRDEFPFRSLEPKVSEADASTLLHSLACVRVENFHPHMREFGFKPMLRAAFDYHDVHYDLPITDVPFNTLFRDNPMRFPVKDNQWLCLSLGLALDGWHYVLVAGVIEV